MAPQSAQKRVEKLVSLHQASHKKLPAKGMRIAHHGCRHKPQQGSCLRPWRVRAYGLAEQQHLGEHHDQPQGTGAQQPAGPPLMGPASSAVPCTGNIARHCDTILLLLWPPPRNQACHWRERPPRRSWCSACKRWGNQGWMHIAYENN